MAVWCDIFGKGRPINEYIARAVTRAARCGISARVVYISRHVTARVVYMVRVVDIQKTAKY